MPVDGTTADRASVGRNLRGPRKRLDPEGRRRRWSRLDHEHDGSRWTGQGDTFSPDAGELSSCLLTPAAKW